MSRRILVLAAVVAAGLAIPGRVSAQSRPTVSPYLNLLTTDQFGNPGGLPGTYQTLVKPFIEQREASLANRADLNRLRSQVDSGGIGPGGVNSGARGYLNRYQNFSHYYPGFSAVPTSRPR